MRRFPILWSLLAAACLHWTIEAATTARITDFNAPSVEPSGRKLIVKGADAETLSGGIMKITKPHVDNYRADGSLYTVMDSSECFFDSKTHDVWSDKDLSMKTADGRLSLKGIGFRFSNSRLVVSNNVEALIRREALVQKTNAVSQVGTNDVLRITARTLDHSSEGITFRGDVLVIDPQGEVRCDILKVRLDDANRPQDIEAIDDVVLSQKDPRRALDIEARGNRAVFNRETGLLRLFENTRWRMGDREGQSELLIVDRTNNTFRAENKVKMTMPSSLLATNVANQAAARSSTNRLTISADTFDYAATNAVTLGPIAIFNGDVHAVDPQATLDCELLTIFFDTTNRLARAVADRNVQITRAEGSIQGVRAVFEKDEITVPANPTWRLKENTGSAEQLVFNSRTREIRAIKNVHMEIPVALQTNLLLSASVDKSTPRTPQSSVTNLLVVTSDYFTNKDNVATFAGNVRASEPRGQIDAGKIEVHLNSTNRVQRIIAENDVILTEQRVQAIGQRADYDVAAGTIRLTGTPKVMMEDRQIIAREFIVDRIKNKFEPIAPFRIEIRNLKKSASAR